MRQGATFRTDLLKHAAKFDGISGPSIKGAHNKLELESLQATKNVKIISTKNTSKDGIYEIEYQLPAYSPQNPNLITHYKRAEVKTVYDPKVYSDELITEMGVKAVAPGYKDAMARFVKSNGRDYQYNGSYGGLDFRAYIAKDKHTGQIYISNVHVVAK